MSDKRDNTLVLIDCFALIHRAYHAFARANLTTSDGQPSHAVYGFAGLLLDVLTKFSPTHVVAVFDPPGPTFRHQQYGQYKANRSKPEDDMISQIPMIEDLLDVFDIPRLMVAGYEADDVIGTIDHLHSGEWARTIIVTGDRDLFQLVDEDTFVYLAGTSFSKSKLFDIEGVKEKMGIGPEHIIDVKGLQGDASDNIPGVAGIGEKGAVGLITEFGDLDNIFKNIATVPNRYQKKLVDNYEIAALSKQLATIVRDVPISFDFDDEADFGTFDPAELRTFFREMEFRSLNTRLEKLIAKHSNVEKVAENDGIQQSMFADKVEVHKWDGGKISGEVFLGAEYEKPTDPLSWKFKHLYFTTASEGVAYLVEGDQISEFFKQDIDWIITDDAKSLLHALQNLNIELKAEVYDIVIATYLQSAGSTKQDLDSVISFHLKDYADTLPDRLVKLPAAYESHKSSVNEEVDLKKLIEIERRLIPVIMQMERNGLTLDVPKMKSFEETLTVIVTKLEQDIQADIGYEFNISSPKQVGEALFDKRGLPSRKKTKTGNYSTDERTLRELVAADPVVQQILDYRELTKLLSTYLKPLPKLVNEQTGRIHAEFNQIGALTGRFSSTNPNMQNIPLGKTQGIETREAFVAAEGSILVSIDYSQQELRLLAELSKEENMMDTFRRGEDIHAKTAMEVFGIESVDKVTKKQRKAGKTINFGIVYGISGFGLADRLKIDPKMASEFINKYFAQYPRVKEYYDGLIEEAKNTGRVETLLGRKRNTVDLHSRNYHIRQATEREVMNFPLQGSAADLIKLAMVEVVGVLDKYPVKMVLQVHDELMFEYDGIDSIDAAKSDTKFLDFVSKVSQTMLGVFKLNVPLEVGVEVGKSWGEMEEIKI